MDEWREIAQHYLRGWFAIDMFTSLPVTFILSVVRAAAEKPTEPHPNLNIGTLIDT